MNIKDLKAGIQEHIYMEDTGVIDVLMAATISARVLETTPVWLVVVGASSSGKSQLLRPIATADSGFVHRLDDLTENTFISGFGGQSGEISLLQQIGSKGVLLISDLTVLFSKNPETRDSILGQLRMIHDGRFVRYFGNQKLPKTWEGTISILSGCTTSLYRHMEKVSDLGERFVYYRLRNVDPRKATEKALSHTLSTKDLDLYVASLYDQYQRDVVKSCDGVIPSLSQNVRDRIMEIAIVGTKLRTPVLLDQKNLDVMRLPSPESPPRVAKELQSIAIGLSMMQYHESGRINWEPTEEQLKYLDWCAYSLANEERRKISELMCAYPQYEPITTQEIADSIGLSTNITKTYLQQLTAIDVCARKGEGAALSWWMKDDKVCGFVKNVNNILQNKFASDVNIDFPDDFPESEE